MKKLQRVVLSPLYYKDKAYNDSIYNLFAHTLFRNISSLQHDISASSSLSERVFTIVIPEKKIPGNDISDLIPSWFHYQEMDTTDLPETGTYVSFLGFAICYCGRYNLIETTVLLIPLCNDEMSWMTQKLAYYSEYDPKYKNEYCVHFYFVPFTGLWDESKANGKTPNGYRYLTFSGEMKKFGLRLLYKDEPELEASLQMGENNEEPTEHCIGIKRSRYDNSEPHDSATNEASCSLGHILIFVGTLLLRICSSK